MLFSFILSLLLVPNKDPSILTVPPIEVHSPSLKEIALNAAQDANLSKEDTRQMIATIKCESHWNPKAVSDTGDYGISQWHLTAHGMTKAQAFDPEYSLNKMAHAFKNGHQEWWTCWRVLFS
ncbi:MAG: transglycosylase SLT domain-containing protein [Gemmatimonadaceae bacterium]